MKKFHSSEMEYLYKLENKILELQSIQKANYLTDKALNTNNTGVTNEKICDKEIIVSLTSYGTRIKDVHLAIESIMQGTVKPNRIILWLSDSENGNQLTVPLQKQIYRGLEVKYCKDLKSYTKLIYSLKEHPESCIITIDDDIMYDFDMVENLINSYQTHPYCVSACRLHRIKLTNGMIESYLNWDWCIEDNKISKLNFLTGVGGALYPPGCFDKEVFNEEVFIDICPTADDVWFNAMLLKNGTRTVKAFHRNSDDLLYIPYSQENSLWKQNADPNDCKNDIQIKAVFDRYNLYHKLNDE